MKSPVPELIQGRESPVARRGSGSSDNTVNSRPWPPREKQRHNRAQTDQVIGLCPVSGSTVRLSASKAAYCVSFRSPRENFRRLKRSKVLARGPCEVCIGKKIGALGMWHGSCGQPQQGAVYSFGREVFMEGALNKSEYDLSSAITFLLVGMGIGSILAVVFNPKQRDVPEEINSWRRSELRPRRKAEERAA